TGVCSNPTKVDGSACSDGDACTQTDSCQAGACAGSMPVVCAAQDACHAAGICTPGTGVCSNPNLPLGTICVTAACVGSTLIKADLCDGNGACVDQGTQSCAPAMCTNLACAAPCMTDQECGPTNYCNAGVCAGKQATSAACAGANQCASGFCADGVCCDSACSKGACDACSAALGASADGTCTLVTGPVCDDGDACTQSDTCQTGACVGGSQVVCMAPDPCHTAGACDPALGLCLNPEKPDSTPCTGGLCNAGTCVADGDGDKIPDVSDICPKMYNPDQADQDGDKIGDVCDTDLDGDGKPNASDNCPTIPNGNQADANSDGVGDACICTPPKQNGEPCDDGDLCTLNDTCGNEVCKPKVSLTCPLNGQVLGACQTSTCIPDVGGCSVFNKVDGAPCQQDSKMGVCIAGGCLVATSSGAGGSGGEPGTGGGSSMSTSGSTGNGSGGAGTMSSAATSGATTGGEAGVGGNEEIRFHGGCSVSRGPESQGPASSAPWLLLGALLAAFPRASRPRARAREHGRDGRGRRVLGHHAGEPLSHLGAPDRLNSQNLRENTE
ncbi:MAG: thrombospondin type 3 repeat-containing protein, partial [Byssovorax sp.]